MDAIPNRAPQTFTWCRSRGDRIWLPTPRSFNPPGYIFGGAGSPALEPYPFEASVDRSRGAVSVTDRISAEGRSIRLHSVGKRRRPRRLRIAWHSPPRRSASPFRHHWNQQLGVRRPADSVFLSPLPVARRHRPRLLLLADDGSHSRADLFHRRRRQSGEHRHHGVIAPEVAPHHRIRACANAVVLGPGGQPGPVRRRRSMAR